jgi:integrase
MASRLTAATVKGLRTEGRYLDGQGLALVVNRADQRYWQYRYQRGGRERVMSLGNADTTTLVEARKLHAEARALLLAGKDPLEERDRAKLDLTRRLADVADAYVAAHEARWRSPKTARLWRSHMRDYIGPLIGKVPVAEIEVQHVLKVLRPIWNTKPVTAGKLRADLETLLDYASAMRWRTGANPAVWRGSMKSLLPAVPALHTTTHHAALDWRAAPAFMTALRARDSMAARVLQFIMLTAARTTEVRGATWSEIDLQQGVWTIPAARMKGGKEHRIPLSAPARDIVRVLADLRTTGDLVFPGFSRDRPLADVSLKRELCRLGQGACTVHGFRSTFRDWAAETTAHPNHVVELALAHAIGNAVEAAYRRGDLIEKRTALMADWATYLAKPEADVVALRAA